MSPVRTAVRMGASWNALARGQFGNLGQRNFQVLVDVVAQRLERRDVDDFGFVRQLADARLANQAIQAEQKGGQRFARSGGR